jgi:hypothetical protein
MSPAIAMVIFARMATVCAQPGEPPIPPAEARLYLSPALAPMDDTIG